MGIFGAKVRKQKKRLLKNTNDISKLTTHFEIRKHDSKICWLETIQIKDFLLETRVELKLVEALYCEKSKFWCSEESKP